MSQREGTSHKNAENSLELGRLSVAPRHLRAHLELSIAGSGSRFPEWSL
jgi:hypothetical protein